MTGPLHPDLDALSAALDGEDVDAAAHARDCPSCGAQLSRLRSVQALVASGATPLPDEVVDRLVVTAVRSSTISPFSEARRRGRRRPPVAWIAAAAAAIAAVAAVPALLGGGDRDLTATGRERGAESAHESGQANDSGGGSGAVADLHAGAGPGAPPTVTGGDLGEHSDPDELVRVVAAMTAMGGDSQPQTESSGRDEASASAAAAVPSECEGSAREIGAGRLGRLVYSASVRWRGAPAEVLAFDLEPRPGVRPGERQLYVLRRAGCFVLAERRF